MAVNGLGLAGYRKVIEFFKDRSLLFRHLKQAMRWQLGRSAVRWALKRVSYSNFKPPLLTKAEHAIMEDLLEYKYFTVYTALRFYFELFMTISD